MYPDPYLPRTRIALAFYSRKQNRRERLASRRQRKSQWLLDLQIGLPPLGMYTR